MYIERVAEVTDEVYTAVTRLVPEIGSQKSIPSLEELTNLVASEASMLWIARYPNQQGEIVGMLTLALYRVPTGLRSIVEDVAVSPDLRRRGIAQALMLQAIEVARGAGAEGLTLSSNPTREAANRLYQAMGFERRDTNAYMYRLK